MASDSENDAYCRVRGLSGKRDDHCDADRLPLAGPWVRRDGYAFAPEIDQAVDFDGFIYTPVMFNEYGGPELEFTTYFTGTHWDGRYWEGYACNDWTASGEEGDSMLGDTTSGSGGWLFSSNSRCEPGRSLLCLQVGPGDPLPPFWRQGARVFVTSVKGSGDLSTWPDAGGETGIAAGDAICQARAAAAGLAKPESFVAWLSDSTHDARDRLTLDGPWTRIDGVPVANDLVGLIGGHLFTAITIDEYGNNDSSMRTWTGTTQEGTYTGESCASWSSDSDLAHGTLGRKFRSDADWTQYSSSTCDYQWGAIYCFSSAVTDVFYNSFESGGTSAWTDSRQ